MSCISSSFRLDAMRSDITMRNLLLLGILMHIYGVFAADELKSVTVTNGDSVTLNINDPKTEKAEELVWTIEGEKTITAKFDRETNKPPIYDDERFSGRLQMDNKTGSLTIMNIRITDSGLYQLQIISISSNIITKRFNVTVQGVTKTVIVTEGDSITLFTGLTLGEKGYNLILCKFKEQLIAEIKQFKLDDSSAGERFNGRLQLHPPSGSFYISDSRSTDSGDYHLEMISSSHTIQRNIDVTVKKPRNSGVGSRISGASVALMVWAVTVFLLQEV